MNTPPNQLLSGSNPERYIPAALRSYFITDGKLTFSWAADALDSIHQDIHMTYNGKNMAQLSDGYGIRPNDLCEILLHQSKRMKSITPSSNTHPQQAATQSLGPLHLGEPKQRVAADISTQKAACLPPDIYALATETVKPLQAFFKLIGLASPQQVQNVLNIQDFNRLTRLAAQLEAETEYFLAELQLLTATRPK